MNSLTEENYLKTAFLLSDQDGKVNVKDLSEKMNVSMPTVTSMAKKLAEKDLFIYESYKPIRLTENGKRTAAMIVRKHRLTEMFLVQVMGFRWDEVHQVAEEIEHIDAPLFFEKMDEMLGRPDVDPHGSPIPDKEGNIVESNYMLLSSLNIGQKCIFRAVAHDGVEFLRYLSARQLTIGTSINVLNKESFDGSVTVSANNQEMMLSSAAAQGMLVEM